MQRLISALYPTPKGADFAVHVIKFIVKGNCFAKNRLNSYHIFLLRILKEKRIK